MHFYSLLLRPYCFDKTKFVYSTFRLYRLLVISTILNAIGLRVEVERMLANGRIDIVAWTSRYIYVMELKLSNNGGMAAAANQIVSHKYLDPFQGDGRQVIGLALELDNQGKGLTDWQVVEI